MKVSNLFFLFFPLLSLGQNLFNPAHDISKEYYENGSIKIEKEMKNGIQEN